MSFMHGWIAVLLITVVAHSTLPAAGPGSPEVRFAKHVIDAQFPAISTDTLDVDGDGLLDVVAAGGPSGGPSQWSNLVYWYKAPKWEKKLVCRLDPKAVILHIESADLLGRHPATAPAQTHTRPAGKTPQVVVTDGQLGQVWLYRYESAKDAWKGSLIVDDVQYAHGIALGDIDRDGYIDVLAPRQANVQKRGLLWAKNPGLAGDGDKPWRTYSLAEKFEIDGWLHYCRLVDLNGDGKLDALHGSDGKGWFGYWLQGADPQGPWKAHVLAGPPTMQKGTNLDAADLDGDGKMDLVGTAGHGLGVWCFYATDFAAHRVDDSLAAAHSLALGDFDGDGKMDIASCGYESKELAWFRQSGPRAFIKHTIDADQCAYDARAVDLNGDGRLDLLLAGQNSGNLVWYENLCP